MSELDLDAIEARAELAAVFGLPRRLEPILCEDVPALVAEVRRLREDRDRWRTRWQGCDRAWAEDRRAMGLAEHTQTDRTKEKTMSDRTVAATITPPPEPGWYAYSGGAQSIIFHLRHPNQWSAHFDNGTAGDCEWGYIEQALSVWDLVKIGPVGLPAEHDQTGRRD